MPVNPGLGDSFLLMCKDVAVYDVSASEVLNEDLLPGAMMRGTMGYDEWMKLRYSAGSNVSARRLMLRAFGTDNHNNVLKATRALSLSDCYWLKERDEDVRFDDITPYLHREWDGSGTFAGGSISTLFVNGNADKRWIDANTLMKVNSRKEIDAYTLCIALGLEKYAAKATVSGTDFFVTNFTSTTRFLESLEQSGYVGEYDDARSVAVAMFKEQATALFTVDYLIESDDRHWGNVGLLRDADTGEYLGMAPYYDFDWIWTDGVIPLPSSAIHEHSKYIKMLCDKAKSVAPEYENGAIITKRADELLHQLT